MSCRSVFRSSLPRAGALVALGMGVLGLGTLGIMTLAGPASAQQMQICSGYGAGFMRMPDSNSCVHVGGGVQAQGFSGGSLSNNANPGSGMSISEGAGSSSLASSALPATAQTASPLTSLSSSAGGNGGQGVDPWKLAR